MKRVLKVSDLRHHISSWLTLFQSSVGFTDREKSVLLEVLIKRNELSKDGINEPFLTKLLFDNDRRKEYCEILDISNYSLNNVLRSLRDRSILSEDYKIQPSLIPEDSLEISFKYV